MGWLVIELSLSVFLFPAFASSPALVGEWPGFARGTVGAIVARDEYAFVANHAGLLIFDVGNASAPKPIGNLRTSAANDLALKEDTVFLADGPQGLRIIDVKNPAKPTLIRKYDVGGRAERLLLSGNLLFVGTASFPDAPGHGVPIFDVSDPKSPKPVGFYDTTNSIAALAVAHNLLFLGETGLGIEIVDIETPLSPRRVHQLRTAGLVSGIAVAGTVLYLSVSRIRIPGGNYFPDTYTPGGLQIFDISDPARPQMVGQYNTEFDGRSVTLLGNRLFLGYGEEMDILDVTNSTSPKFLKRLRGPTSKVSEFGRILYAPVLRGFEIFDQTDPGNPTKVASFDTTGEANDMTIAGNLAFVSDANAGLKILNVTNPFNPKQVGQYGTNVYCRAVTISGNLGFVPDLGILDVSDPSMPILLRADNFDYSSCVVATNNLAVIPFGNFGNDSLRIVDTSNPRFPTELSNFKSGGYISGLALTGDRLYVGYSASTPLGIGGLDIVEIKDPNLPVRIGRYSFEAVPWAWPPSVTVASNLVFISRGRGGLQIVDVSSPQNPILLSTYYLDESSPDKGIGIRSAVVQGNLAFLAAYDRGVHILDIHDPTHPVRVATYNARPSDANFYGSAAYAFNLSVAGNNLFVATGNYGIQVLDISNLATPALRLNQQSGALVLELEGYPSQEYQLEWTTAISDQTEWFSGNTITLKSNPERIPIVGQSSVRRFYRARLLRGALAAP